MASNSEQKDFSMFSIAGNIKQRFLPFLLLPNSPLNDFKAENNKAFNSIAATASPQLFTYKTQAESDGGYAHLGFFPMSIHPDSSKSIDWKTGYPAANQDKDISFKNIYGTEEKKKNALTIFDIIDNIPGVSIREFLPDTRLDQCINIFRDLFSKSTGIAADAMNVQGSSAAEKNQNLTLKILACTEFVLRYMTGTFDHASFLNDTFKNIKNTFRKSSTNVKDPDSLINKYVHNFPFALYYRLQTCTTTNIYEVPAMCEGKIISSSDGQPGWGDGSDFMGAGGFGVSGLLNKIPGVGEIASMVIGNIGVNYMPWWNADSGTTRVTSPEINIKFDLFNDNVYKALVNFIFVNTIVPSNKWIQYNMFQHSSNLYDVKIEGINRLFACSGKFDVTYEGVLRNPSEKFLKELKSHLNENLLKDNFLDQVKKNNLIKIPDVYRVNMSFKSILPANFNNYLYTWTQNFNHMSQYDKGVNDAGLGAMLKDGFAAFGKRIKYVWNHPDADPDKDTPPE